MTSPRRERIRKIVGILVLILAILFLFVGGVRKIRAYDEDKDGFGILTFQKLSETQIVEDSTFAGVVREDGRLFSTYDHSKPMSGKRACPT